MSNFAGVLERAAHPERFPAHQPWWEIPLKALLVTAVLGGLVAVVGWKIAVMGLVGFTGFCVGALAVLLIETIILFPL